MMLMTLPSDSELMHDMMYCSLYYLITLIVSSLMRKIVHDKIVSFFLFTVIILSNSFYSFLIPFSFLSFLSP